MVEPGPAAPTAPLLPDGTLPPVALLVRWLERVRASGATSVLLPSLPPGNAFIPDLLRLGGIQEVACPESPLRVLRWEGSGGSRVQLLRDRQAIDADEEIPLHAGALPARSGTLGWDPAAVIGLLDLARLEDACATVGAGSGAAWDGLLAAGDWMESASRPPPVLALMQRDSGDGLGVWNPLPIPRLALVALNPPSWVRTAPWSLQDGRGRRHPVQVAEGTMGQVWLVQVPLGALEGTTLTDHDDPAPGSHWEVSETVIDNGRVRVELDALGQISRLCWDGVFADLAGPACAPAVDGLSLGGTAQISVLEDGPVRARLSVRRETPAGRLDLTYTLHAHEDHLRVSASWSGDRDCWLDHPAGNRSADLHLCGEGMRWAEPQAASALRPPMQPTPGIRWATLADIGGRGLALAAGRPMTLHALSGHLRILVAPTASWALAAPRRPPGAMGLGTLAEHLALPGRPLPGGVAVPPAFRLAEGSTLVPLWVRRPEGWSGELLLAEQTGARGRAFLHAGALGEAWKVDAAGEKVAALAPTPEGDGWQLDHGAGELLIIRWR